MALPLEGVRIVEMGQLIAIPHAIKLLADMGAEVIRIDSCARLDNYRTSSLYGNSADGEYWNRAANFYEQNRNKLGITLDLTKPEGIETLRQLVSVSDVFAENFTPRVMRNFGIEYAELRRIRPDIIVVSSTGYGYTGPWSGFGAIGYTTEASSGLSHITGYEDGPPTLPELPYADYTAAEHTAFAIVAALIHRARTGRGQLIDVSQTETLSATIPEALLDYTANGRVRGRIGNGDDAMAPHGCYPCKGRDRWIAISVATDAQWRALCGALGRLEWARDARFGDGPSRLRHRDALDELLGEATRERDQMELMRALQSAGVPAGAVLDGKQLLFNEHLKARGFYEVVAHHPSTAMPPLPYASRPWKMSDAPARIRRAAPILGEHNRLVLADMLGTSEADVAALEAKGVIGYAPTHRGQPPSAPSLDELKLQGRILDYELDFKERIKEEYGV
ncbi:MAG: CoA transferase [Chloroflexi bacterium]|nr:CoA transferase [Chloroflexota bacterium]